MNIFLLPSIAATALLSPFSLNEYVFSRMMIEASTVIPMPRIRPDMLIELIDMPNIAISISVISMHIGIDSEIIIVVFIPLRKMKMMRAARITPWTAELNTSFIVSEIISVESRCIMSVIPSGRLLIILGSSSLMLFATVVSLLSESFDTESVTTSCPSM